MDYVDVARPHYQQRHSSLHNRRYEGFAQVPSTDDTELPSLDSREVPVSSPVTATSSPKLLGGKPAPKKRFNNIDVFATLLSWISLGVAIASVASHRLSWHLGQGTNQLILLGFILSVMNQCLSNITPTFFLLLEARFGMSTFHNFDGLLRNSPLAPRFSLFWRLVLVSMLALPIALSVAYKSFIGGTSTLQIKPSDFTGNDSYYGVLAPPGLENIGIPTGLNIFLNSTLDFAVRSSPTGGEPDLPLFPQAYGYNVLLLDSDSAAFLDIPQPSYIDKIQSSLALGETWTMSAPVFGTVAALNPWKQNDPANWNRTFMSRCMKQLHGPSDKHAIVSCQNNACIGTYGSGTYSHSSMNNGWGLQLLSDVTNQSYQYLGILPDPGLVWISECWVFSQYARLYNITRNQCQGNWSITRGSVNLISGSCNETLPTEYQYFITRPGANSMFLGNWYMQVLAELLGPFATPRNGSDWDGPSFATAVAGMLWSRIVSLYSAAKLAANGEQLVWANTPDHRNLTYEEIGLFYQVDDTGSYTRPTLIKSRWLYFALAIQPLLSLVILGLIATMHSTPIGKGFNMIAVLSGVDPKCLEALSGAAFSGELAHDFKISARPTNLGENGNAFLRYNVVSPEEKAKHGKLEEGMIYH